MGRKVQPRDSYLGEAMSIGRLREAARIDPTLTPEQLADLDEKTTALVNCLMRIETERTKDNGSTGKEKTNSNS